METKISGQKEWSWKVASYFFFEGSGAGAYIIGVILGFAGLGSISKTAIISAFPLVFIGTLFLLSDLGVKNRAFKASTNLTTSWISRGVLIVSAFMTLMVIHIITGIWPFSGIKIVIAIVASLFAILAMSYTALLLGASKPIALWSTAGLPVLFIISDLSLGAMFILLFSSIQNFISPQIGTTAQLVQLVKINIWLIVIELVVLFFYIQATHRISESRASAQLILKQDYSKIFWRGVIVLGLLIPLILSFLQIVFLGAMSLPFSRLFFGLVISIPALVGGLLLRQVILAAGVRAPLRAGGIEYAISSSAN